MPSILKTEDSKKDKKDKKQKERSSEKTSSKAVSHHSLSHTDHSKLPSRHSLLSIDDKKKSTHHSSSHGDEKHKSTHHSISRLDADKKPSSSAKVASVKPESSRHSKLPASNTLAPSSRHDASPTVAPRYSQAPPAFVSSKPSSSSASTSASTSKPQPSSKPQSSTSSSKPQSSSTTSSTTPSTSTSKAVTTFRPPPSHTPTASSRAASSIFVSPKDETMAAKQTRIEKMTGKERTEQEAWAQQQLTLIGGTCSAGFAWHRVEGGYRCFGGMHFVTDELLAEGKGGCYNMSPSFGMIGPVYRDFLGMPAFLAHRRRWGLEGYRPYGYESYGRMIGFHPLGGLGGFYM